MCSLPIWTQTQKNDRVAHALGQGGEGERRQIEHFRTERRARLFWWRFHLGMDTDTTSPLNVSALPLGLREGHWPSFAPPAGQPACSHPRPVGHICPGGPNPTPNVEPLTQSPTFPVYRTARKDALPYLLSQIQTVTPLSRHQCWDQRNLAMSILIRIPSHDQFHSADHRQLGNQ